MPAAAGAALRVTGLGSPGQKNYEYGPGIVSANGEPVARTAGHDRFGLGLALGEAKTFLSLARRRKPRRSPLR